MKSSYSLFKRAYGCYRIYGATGTVRVVAHKLKAYLGQRHPALLGDEKENTSYQLFSARFANLRPINIHLQREDGHRYINLVTDSVGQSSLFGGVGTALIFAIQLANTLDASLRIVTRTERARSEDIKHFLALYDLTPRNEISFNFAWIHDARHELELHPKDLMITTSWWTTASILPNVPPHQIIYILQEDERMFYPFGDERYLCEQTLKTQGIRFVINTELLYRHLTSSGLPHIEESGLWFEPAFPASIFHPREPADKSKKRLFFYARPNNARNLFFLGIEVLRQALMRNVISPDGWEICFVGKDIPDEIMLDEIPVRCIKNLKWNEYAELIGTVDLALSLMDTPHPSYPPLDIAASGGVVVTNQHGLKRDLAPYSENIICTPCEIDALVQGLREGVALSSSAQRFANFTGNGLSRNWEETFRKTVRQIATGETT